MVREWDPWSASPAELRSVLETLNAIIAADLPGDPRWRDAMLREYFGVTMPGERRLCWVAETSPGAAERGEPILGLADLLLLDDTGILELLVHPRARRRRVGQTLLTTTVARAHKESLASLGAEAIGGTPAVGFFEACGFRCAYVETRSLLSLDEVDWAALRKTASEVAAGYRVEYHAGGLPDELVEPYAEAKQFLRDSPDGDLRTSSYDPDRLRASVATLNGRGMRPHMVVAIHEPSGKVAALTEVVAPVQHPSRADQYDTIVLPNHRGYGVTRAIKARMLIELRAAEPLLREVQTWNAPDNEFMLKVNGELGFQPDREWREYEADVPDLAQRFG